VARNSSVKIALGLLLILTGLAGGLYTAKAPLPVWSSAAALFAGQDSELEPGDCFTVVDEKGRVVDCLGRAVAAGDELVTAEGKHYRVVRSEGRKAVAQLLGMDRDVLAWEEYFDRAVVPVGLFGSRREVGIYHTHSDESYVPTDGAIAIPYRGGILKVGDRLSQNLQTNGTRVLHNKTPHDPHDAQAYLRSRKTAVRLLKTNPLALFDVHRDGIPDPDFYREEIKGRSVGQIRLVVGRQNPRMSSNLDFAKRLMTYANRIYPGLVKGIFLGRGSYNQDLLPTALLLECGTHTLTRTEAERGVGLLADAVPVVLGLTGPRPGMPEMAKPITDKTAKTPGVWRAFIWILVATVVGVGAYLVISAGSWEAARERLRSFWRREANMLRNRGRQGENKP
jgi:stage II sporulation protein P